MVRTQKRLSKSFLESAGPISDIVAILKLKELENSAPCACCAVNTSNPQSVAYVWKGRRILISLKLNMAENDLELG